MCGFAPVVTTHTKSNLIERLIGFRSIGTIERNRPLLVYVVYYVTLLSHLKSRLQSSHEQNPCFLAAKLHVGVTKPVFVLLLFLFNLLIILLHSSLFLRAKRNLSKILSILCGCAGLDIGTRPLAQASV